MKLCRINEIRGEEPEKVVHFSLEPCTRDEPSVSKKSYSISDYREVPLKGKSTHVVSYSCRGERKRVVQCYDKIPLWAPVKLNIFTLCCPEHFPRYRAEASDED